MEDSASILELKGIGEKSQKLFAKVNIRTLGDLLYYYPRDYEMFREPVPLSGQDGRGMRRAGHGLRYCEYEKSA